MLVLEGSVPGNKDNFLLGEYKNTLFWENMRIFLIF